MKKSSAKISTLVAVSGSLAALPAAALELGDVQVNSSLGQPLRASIAYALAPNEDLISNCVSLQGGLPQNDLPMIGPATITIAGGIISIAGSNVIREPLLTMRLNVRCPYTANLSREYMLFVDPAGVPAQVAAPQTVVAPQPVVASVPVATRRRVASREPIANATRHRVQRGDTLSEIAQRIVDRPVGLWAAVGAIFDANPDAFIGNDPNKLKAGSWLFIPDFGGGTPQVVADAGADVFEPVEPAAAASANPGISVDPAEIPATVAGVAAIETVGDAVNPFIDTTSPINESSPINEIVISIPDTVLESPPVTSTSPNVPTASIRATPVEKPSINWIVWLVGAGIAAIAAFLFFGRPMRQRFGSSPIGAVAVPARRRSDNDTQRVGARSEIAEELENLTPLQDAVALDADLIIGTGLQRGSDIHMAQNFGFAATTNLDLELPEEMSSGGNASSQTDIIPPFNIEMQSMLESEVLPEIDDDYDMSVIIDATKMPQHEDVTQKDLEAIPLEISDDTLITDDYTVSHEVDYTVLEQDYEDELTATQVLNMEISRAAAELAERMDGELGDKESTSEMSMASITALDITAQLPAKNDDDISDLDDTGVNEAITVDMRADDNTVEMPKKKGKSA